VRFLGRAAAALALLVAMAPAAAAAQRLDGFNVIQAPGHPFGGASALRALMAAKRVGATAIAIIPFLWQPAPASPDLVRGNDMSDADLREAIRQVRGIGLAAVVKPHVWVPESWAGAVAPGSERDWRTWFGNLRREIVRIARIAAEEQAEALVVGTELARTSRRPEWNEVIAAARGTFPGQLLYVAHNDEEALAIPFWPQLDAIGVSLYPVLGDDLDRTFRLAAMRAAIEPVERLADRSGKPIVVGEIGLRSAVHAASKPWESAEERASAADPMLQAEVLADWLTVLDRAAVQGVLIWRWLSDPLAGGPADTDFTVQGKPAEGVLLCVWRLRCGRN
jgi:hypothetical protein